MRYLALLATLALGNLVIIVMLVALATCHLADALLGITNRRVSPIHTVNI